MEQFDWKAHLSDTFHSSFTLSGRRPVIGITGNYGEQTCKLAETYYKQVVKAGGTPLIIPPLSDKESVVNTLNSIDGVSDRDFCVEMLSTCSIIMMHLSRFSEEIILW